MAEQLTFDLPSVPALGRADFFVSIANAAAVGLIDEWQNWPNAKQLLVGPHGSGKTHLAHVWAGLSNAQIISAADIRDTDIDALCQTAICVEDIDEVAGRLDIETELFHLHNLCLSRGHALLFTSSLSASAIPFDLADLASRVQGTAAVTLTQPDDALLNALLLKQFADRQLMPAPTVTQFLARNMERSFAMIARVVEEMDRQALVTGRSLNRGLAADVLDKITDNGA